MGGKGSGIKKLAVEKKQRRIVVRTNNRKYFDNAGQARMYAIRLLEAGLTYLEIDEVDE